MYTTRALDGQENGGAVMFDPIDVPAGRLTVAADPEGAVFAVITLPEG
jgi:predicted enzyme related to lactoylglutathione lyase